jgi:hypothetical protein
MKGKRETLTIAQILKWADLHQLRTGEWPTSRTGPILDQPDRTWESVQTALIKGTCGLPGGSSLHQLLVAKRRAKDPRLTVPDLTLPQVLKWVDSHWARTGRWPHRDDGSVADCPQISWGTIDRRMRRGELLLPRGTTLATWLRDVRGVWDGGKPMLTEKLVIKWAKDHYARFGRWPVTLSGDLYNRPDENWAAIDVGLRNQRRGFPYRTSLSQLLRKHFGDDYDKHVGTPKDRPRGPQARRVLVRKPVAV